MARPQKEPSVERIAEILVEGFRARNWDEVAKKHNVSERTLRRWKARIDTDPVLADHVRRKNEASSAGWAQEADETLIECVRFIRRAARNGDATKPNMVHSVAGAMKLLADVNTARVFLERKLAALKSAADAGIDRTAGAPRAPAEQAPGSGSGAHPPVH